MNPIHVDQRGTMNAERACPVEPAFQINDGLIDRVAQARHHRVSELILRDEVADSVEVEKRDALADPGGNAARIVGPLLANGLAE